MMPPSKSLHPQFAPRERPILFSAAMVRAVLAVTKTQTRRVAKIETVMGRDSIMVPWRRDGKADTFLLPEHAAAAADHCPYGQPGDQLWVREAWRASLAFEITKPSDIPAGTPIHYEANQGGALPRFNAGKLRPGMFMPRWASRLTLEVTSVRVERLQDISEADAIAEGVTTWRDEWDTKTAATMFLHGAQAAAATNDGGVGQRLYHLLWEQINGPDSWAANPWVWVVEFRRITP